MRPAQINAVLKDIAAKSAIEEFHDLVTEAAREPEEAFRLWSLAIVHHALGNREESDEALRTALRLGGFAVRGEAATRLRSMAR